jgi:(heptosyl)LPS beta-1,4-glucosyltransferase
LKVQLAKEGSTMPKISAVINTRNEERNIRYCLETLKWCDEIIVVDMESEDKTVEIAKEFTDKIYSHEKVLAFDIARKFAVGKATGDWVLLIDADEMVTKLLSSRLKDIAANDEADIVYMPFKTFIMGVWIKHTGWWPEYHPRFFKRGAITFVDTIHAYMNVSASAKKIYLPPDEINSIEHFAYRDSEHFITKLNRYTTIEAKHMFDQGKRFSFIRLLVAGFRGFQVRYISQKGYKDGYRGLFLSLMMGFYRTLNYIKLWECWENKNLSVEDKYRRLKENIIKEYSE